MRKSLIILIATILVLCASCNLDPADFPTASPQGGTVDYGTSVTLQTTATKVQIRYTLDGTEPTYESTLYESPIQLTEDTVLMFAAFNKERMVSDVISHQYNMRVTTPTADLAPGIYCEPKTVTLSCATPGSTIYYTLDGSTPTRSSTVYSSAITIENPIIAEYKTLKMIAVANGCADSEVTSILYSFYTAGPAGGYVFYDCDADNDETNDGAGPDNLKSTTCGWRYLEAAPADISVGTTMSFVFGYYRETSNGDNLFVNGSTTYVAGTADPNDGKSTDTAIGTGKANTAKLVSKMGPSAYSESSGSDTTADYASKLCDDYTYGGYSDWFLPSRKEVELMSENLSWKGIGAFWYGNYWSSSENGSNAKSSYPRFFYAADQFDNRNQKYRVRAARSFLSFEED